MRRLTYSPKVNAYIRPSNSALGIIDVSPYIVRGNVHRKTDQVSEATIEMRNPFKQFTVPGRPMFHPMDPVTIYLTRLRGHPIQVFTGYLDETPYLQLFPDTITLSASCTLKRLLYTYWDPGLPHVTEFMARYGWEVNRGTGQLFNPDIESVFLDDAKNVQLQDGSIGNLLFATLKHVGSWDSNTIFIEKLPDGIVESVSRVYNDIDNDNQSIRDSLKTFLHKAIGSGSSGTGGGNTGSTTGEIHGASSVVPVIVQAAKDQGIPPEFAVGVSIHECGLDPSRRAPSTGATGYYQWLPSPWGYSNSISGSDQALQDKSKKAAPGSYQKCGLSENFLFSESKDLGKAAYAFCRSAKLALGQNPQLKNNLVAWAEYVQGATGQFSSLPTDIAQANDLVSKYGQGNAGTKSRGAAPKATVEDVQKGGKDQGSQDSQDPSADKPKIYAVLQGAPTAISAPFGQVRPTHIHHGIDVPTPFGTPCFAPCDGKIGTFAQTTGFGDGGGMIHFVFTQQTGQIAAGTVIGWGHVSRVFVKPGERVKAGQKIALSGTAGTGPHVHFIRRQDSNDMDGTVDPAGIFLSLEKGQASDDQSNVSSSSSTDGVTADNANASAFATFLAFPSIEDTALSLGLQGQKSLMNDKPLLPFIQQLSEASLRSFMSLPNGDFYAFYPDYFGGFGRKAYWSIDSMEIMDGGISISDDTLATHVYIVGDTLRASSLGGDNVHFLEQLQSGGVMTIYNAFKAGFVNLGDGLVGGQEVDPETGNAVQNASGHHLTASQRTTLKNALSDGQALSFLQKYGARPHYEDAPMVRSPFFEAFLAWQRFCRLWASQFRSTFKLTFMPEVFPGGIVAFEEFDIQCYVDEVIHNFDYESGFTTEAVLSSPASISGKLAISGGMVNADALDIKPTVYEPQHTSAKPKPTTHGTHLGGSHGD
jgi:murein DD-endopeptidase MepM/ murein hydrolase activator NlpD